MHANTIGLYREKVLQNHCTDSVFSLKRYPGNVKTALNSVECILWYLELRKYFPRIFFSPRNKDKSPAKPPLSRAAIKHSHPHSPSSNPLLPGPGPAQDKWSSCQRKWSLQVADFSVSKRKEKREKAQSRLERSKGSPLALRTSWQWPWQGLLPWPNFSQALLSPLLC